MIIFTIFSIESAGDRSEEYDAKGQRSAAQDLILKLQHADNLKRIRQFG